MAARRPSRTTTSRTTAPGKGVENSLASKSGPANSSGAPALAKDGAKPTQKPLTARVGLAVKSATLAVKSSNIATTTTATTGLPVATRKRTILHETTNATAGPSKTTFRDDKPEGSSTTAPRRYGTRSSTGGGSAGGPTMIREDADVESEDTVMEDVTAPLPAHGAAARAIKPIRKAAALAAKVPNSVAIRQRRIAAEELAERAAQELEDAKRAEEEHRSKKARTSEPDFDEDVEGDVAEEDVEDEGAKLKDEGWEDLDEGDEDDPLMVTEYVNEVYDYLRKLELTTMPNAEYMQEQNEVTWKMRGILIDWLIEIHTKFRLLPETIFLATNIIDRMLSVNVVSLVKFQLVGITALFIASKYEEVTCPSVQNFLYVTDGGYEDDEILRAERYVLGMLDFNLSYPNPINFLRRISKADGYDIHSRTMAKYLMEISIVDHKFIAIPPSLIAAAGSWLARRILNKGDWNANLIHYSGYTEQELKPTAQLMLDYVVRSSSLANPNASKENPLRPGVHPEDPEHPNFIKKYAAKKFFKASISVRKWAEATYAPIEKRNPVTRKIERTVVPATL